MIRIRNLHKSYQMGKEKLEILKNLNLDIHQNELVSIMGPSGSGKSTLLNILGCLDTPTFGTYQLENKNISNFNEAQLALIRNEKLGFIFQSFHLIAHYSVLQNVMLPLIYSCSNNTDRIAVAKTLLEQVGLEHRLTHLPNELSGGERQRVAIARALVNNPSIILADEPTGNLDSQNGDSILEILKNIHQKGKTVIIVTHDLAVACQTQRIISMQDGRICNAIS